MKNRIKVLLGAIFLAVTTLASAQGFVVRGKVIDPESKEPIIGATVVEVNEADGRFLNGTITDFNGDFSLEVGSASSTVKVSFIGFKEQVLKIEGQQFLNISLQSDIKQLSDVTIVATKMQSDGLSNIAQRDLTSSSVTVDMTDMEEVAATSADEALQGQLAGVDIVMNSGDPGAGSTFVIRGMSSMNGSDPLFVIDGIPQMQKASSDFDFGSADVDDIGDLVSIPPSDIKAITVLKDAASTAQWGSEGANGVILIETNKGSKGKTRFEYLYKFYYDKQPPQIPMLNGDEYIIMQREELFNPNGLYSLPEELALDPGLGAVYYNNSQNTDWIDEVTHDFQLAHEHNFKVSGGGEKTRYYASLNYYDRGSTTINSGFKRLTNRVNLDYLVSDNLKFSANFVYANSQKADNYKYVDPDDRNTDWSVRSTAYVKAPNASVYEYDNYGNKTGNFYTPITNYQSENGKLFNNPVAMALLGNNDSEDNKIQTNFLLQYRFNDNWNFKATVAYDYLNSKLAQFLPYTAIGANWLDSENNLTLNSDQDQTRLMIRFQTFFNKTIGTDHVFVGSGTWDIRNDNFASGASGTNRTASLLVTDPAALAPFGWVENNIGLSRLLSARGNLSYKLKDRYVAAFTFSAEGSTKFGTVERWGFFPSGSLMWRFGSEPMLDDVSWLGRESRARFSYGITGNSSQIGNFDRHATYSTWGKYISNAAVLPAQIQLDNLKWESSSNLNIGFDAYLFNEKLDITFDAYKKNTTDVLWKNYKIPTSSGKTILKWYNGGEVENVGWEFAANYEVFRNKEWLVKVNANVSQNINKFLAFPDNFNNEVSSTVENRKFPQRANVGEPIGSFYGLKYLGVYSTNEDAIARDASGNVMYDLAGEPLKMSFKNGSRYFEAGDAKYADINHDGSIDILDAVYLGDSNPKIFGGFGASATFRKSITLSVGFFSRLQYQIVNGTAQNTQGMSDKRNQSTAVLHRWRTSGMDYDDMIPRAYMNDVYNNLGSDRYVEDGDFLRLNNVSIKYKFSKEVCQKLNISALSANLNGRKLALWTGYSGQSPEIAPSGDPFWMGVDNSKTPVPMVYSFSLNVTF